MRLILNIPTSPEGTEFDVPGLGRFANGGTYEIDEDQYVTFQQFGLHKGLAFEDVLVIGVEEADLNPRPETDGVFDPARQSSSPVAPVGESPEPDVFEPPVDPDEEGGGE